MVPWELLDTAPIPGSGGLLRLMRRGSEFVIRLDGLELMSSRSGGSEEMLARLGCAGLAGVAAPRVLIGGLGLGFTLRAALALLGREAEVTVAELVPAVVAWGRGPLAALHAGSLDDPRVRIAECDVADALRRSRSTFDVILLDVDNGPEALTSPSNAALYGSQGLAGSWRALRPGGTLAVWSSAPDDGFTRRLHRTGFAVTVSTARATGKRGARHVIWVATRGA